MLPVRIANYIFDRFLQWAQTNFVFSILNSYMNIVYTNMRANINFVSEILRYISDLMHTTVDVLVPSLHVHIVVL